MQIEEGKFYKTRDGRKVGPYRHNFRDLWIVGDDHTTACFENGKVNLDRDSPEDIVSEWQDSPVRDVTRKEIVPGWYGIVGIVEGDKPEGTALVRLDRSITGANADELRAAAATFIAIAEALETNK